MSGGLSTSPLVAAEELAEHLNDPDVRVIDIHLDPSAYERGHLPGALAWPALGTIMDAGFRHVLDPAEFAELLGRSGISETTTVVCTSQHPGLGPWAYWYLRTMGHDRVTVLDGGVSKWASDGNPLTTEAATADPVDRRPSQVSDALCADREDVVGALADDSTVLLDVRTIEEFNGEIFLLEPPTGEERAGHLPGATHVYFERAHNDDLTFKSRDELVQLYAEHGVERDTPVITYCAVGMRSAHTWFVLSELLGYQDVTSYHRSWNEWGRLPDTAIES